MRFIRPSLTCILSHAKCFAFAIKHKPFTRDQGNLQKTSATFKSLLRNPVNKGMTLEQGGPNGRKVGSLVHRFGA